MHEVHFWRIKSKNMIWDLPLFQTDRNKSIWRRGGGCGGGGKWPYQPVSFFFMIPSSGDSATKQLNACFCRNKIEKSDRE